MEEVISEAEEIVECIERINENIIRLIEKRIYKYTNVKISIPATIADVYLTYFVLESKAKTEPNTHYYNEIKEAKRKYNTIKYLTNTERWGELKDEEKVSIIDKHGIYNIFVTYPIE
tara:strand:- start:3264 stop:3614 length:351 start_codon:yes stop_codon:yes gene_type:complete